MLSAPIEADLVFQERQFVATKNSLSGVKKRLHEAELYLNVEPDYSSEPGEWELWKKRVDGLITSKGPLPFPKIEDVREELKIEADKARKNVSNNTKKHGKDTWENYLRYLRLKRQMGPCKFFGMAAEGEEIGRIMNYAGCNTAHGDTRILSRKDPRPGLFTEQSSLPHWFGPGYYESVDAKILDSHGGCVAKIPFEASSRYPELTADELRAMKKERARRVALVCHSDSRLSFLSSSERRSSDEAPTELRDTNPFSRLSSSSTILVPNPLSRGVSPTRVLLGAKSIKNVDKRVRKGASASTECQDDEIELPIFVDDTVSVELPEGQASDLAVKIVRASAGRYRCKDYTMGALSQQLPFDRHYHEKFEKDEFNEDFPMDSTTRIIHRPPIGETATVTDDSFASSTSLGSYSFASKLYGRGSKGIKLKDGKQQAEAENEKRADAGLPRYMQDRASGKSGKHFVVSLSSLARDKKRSADAAKAASRSNLPLLRPIQKRRLPDADEESSLVAENILGTSEDEAARAILTSPLKEDVRPKISKWFVDREIYSPPRPQTTTYLKEFVAMQPVNVGGLLFGENSGKTREEVLSDAALASEYAGFISTLNSEVTAQLISKEEEERGRRGEEEGADELSPGAASERGADHPMRQESLRWLSTALRVASIKH